VAGEADLQTFPEVLELLVKVTTVEHKQVLQLTVEQAVAAEPKVLEVTLLQLLEV
jgi:hypothetical protein